MAEMATAPCLSAVDDEGRGQAPLDISEKPFYADDARGEIARAIINRRIIEISSSNH